MVVSKFANAQTVQPEIHYENLFDICSLL